MDHLVPSGAAESVPGVPVLSGFRLDYGRVLGFCRSGANPAKLSASGHLIGTFSLALEKNLVLHMIIGFFEADVLSLYESKPDKYELHTDFFEGVLKTTDTYFSELESFGKQDESISIRFGYHSKKDSTLCIAVYLPDLARASEIEQRKWEPFKIEKSLLLQEDERFEMWRSRYFQGNWDVPCGPRGQLVSVIEKVNACCKTLVGLPLYTEVPDKSVRYPSAQNSHAYEDAHRNLYGFLVDSLSKDCLLDLASLRNQAIHKPQNMRSTTLLRHVFFEFDQHSKLHSLLSIVSEQRGKSSHGVRPAATKSDAFADFHRDLQIAVEAYEELVGLIESKFCVSSDHELRRHECMNFLPKLVGGVEPRYSICQATKMEGKTVKKVHFGMREDSEDRHQSQALHVEFTDGAILGIETGSNARNIADRVSMRTNEFHVDFMLTWVPAPSNR